MKGKHTRFRSDYVLLSGKQLVVPLDHSTRVNLVEGSRSVLIGCFYCISLKYQSLCCAQALAVDWFKLNSRHSKAAHHLSEGPVRIEGSQYKTKHHTEWYGRQQHQGRSHCARTAAPHALKR